MVYKDTHHCILLYKHGEKRSLTGWRPEIHCQPTPLKGVQLTGIPVIVFSLFFVDLLIAGAPMSVEPKDCLALPDHQQAPYCQPHWPLETQLRTSLMPLPPFTQPVAPSLEPLEATAPFIPTFPIFQLFIAFAAALELWPLRSAAWSGVY